MDAVVRLTRGAPVPDDDLIFRFAATGDPRLGFTSMQRTKRVSLMRLSRLIDPGRTPMLGDMIHFKTDFKAYETMQELVSRHGQRLAQLQCNEGEASVHSARSTHDTAASRRHRKAY